jgi:hypothetical protein
MKEDHEQTEQKIDEVSLKIEENAKAIWKKLKEAAEPKRADIEK